MLVAPKVEKGYIAVPVSCGMGFRDPIHELDHIHGLALGMHMPEGINTSINTRVPWPGQRMYKDMSLSMVNENVPVDDIFHLGCLGMTILTTDVHIEECNGAKWVVFNNRGEFCGTINGRHIYHCALSHKGRFEELQGEGIDNKLLIPFHVMGGDLCSNKKVTIWVSKASSRGTQISDEALMNADGVFDPIKVVLKEAGILQYFGFKANETKVDREKVYTGAQCLRLLEALNIEQYPITNPDLQPNSLFGAQYSLLDTFWNDPHRYDNSLNLLSDFWQLFETIRAEGYSKLPKGSKPPKDYAFTEQKGNMRPFFYPIIGEEEIAKVTMVAAGAILASFRHFLAQDKNGQYLWAPNFEYVLSVWKRFGGVLMNIVKEHIGERKASDRAKLKSLWLALFGQMENIRLKGMVNTATKGVGGNPKSPRKRDK